MKNTHNGQRTAHNGFTLFEILVSVVILSTALVLILNSFMRAVRAIDFSESYFKAGLLIREKMFGLCNSDIEEGSSEGVFDSFGEKFSWELLVTDLEEEKLYEVKLDVLWNQGTKQKRSGIYTYRTYN